MNKNIKKLLIPILCLIIVGIVAWQVFTMTTSAQPLSEADAKNLVTELYSGEILDISLNKNLYQVTLEIDERIYEVMIEKNSGEVFGIYHNTPEEKLKEISERELAELTEEDIQNQVLQQYQGDIKKFIRTEQDQNVFYEIDIEDENERKMLRVDAFSGQIDLIDTTPIESTQNSSTRITENEAIHIALETVSGEVDDVDVEQRDGITYYFVEIERNDDREATVQINAITGEVVSTFWDD